MELYAGTHAPINFNGLVRQYYLRSRPEDGDLQVNLIGKHERAEQSHEIALSVRQPLYALPNSGMPTSRSSRCRLVRRCRRPLLPRFMDAAGRPGSRPPMSRKLFEATTGWWMWTIPVEAPALKYRVAIDRAKAAQMGVAQQTVVAAITAALGGEDASYLHSASPQIPGAHPAGDGRRRQSPAAVLADLRVRNRDGQLIALSELIHIMPANWDQTRYHKDGMPVIYVTGDDAGNTDSPLYGMFGMVGKLGKTDLTSTSSNSHPWALHLQ